MPSTLPRLLELIRFSHTLFALPFALWAALMAWTYPSPWGAAPPFRWQDLGGILWCMVAARSAAMAFNRWADRHFDAANPRTKDRHLPTGVLSERAVVWFTVCSSVAFLAGTFFFWPNPLPPLLGPWVLGFLLAYSYTKRFTALSHFWLGTALMLAPVSAWIAVRGEIIWRAPQDLWLPLVLGSAVLLWVAGFDIIYACQDTQFDRHTGLYSIPAALGNRQALRCAAACHLATMCILASLPWMFPQLGLSWLYTACLIGVGTLLTIEHWIVRPDDLSRVNVAFFYVNISVSMALLVFGGADLLW